MKSKLYKIKIFLNIINYIFWLNTLTDIKFIAKWISKLIFNISKILLSHEKCAKLANNLHENYNNVSSLIDLKDGICIRQARIKLESVCLCYACFIIFSIWTMAIIVLGEYNKFICFLIILLGLACSLIIIHLLVYKNHQYIKYFSKFRNKDKEWHKKWKRYNRVFILGGISVLYLTVISMLSLLILFDV